MKRIKAPFLILKRECFYYFWLLFVVVFGLINIWIGLIIDKQEVINSFLTGHLYTFSIALCAPFFMILLQNFIISRSQRREVHFTRYKIACLLINLFWILFILFLCFEAKQSLILQILTSSLSIAFAFYMYCVNEMATHKGLLNEFEDSDYLKREEEDMKEIKSKKDKLDKIDEEGGIEL